MGYGVQEWQEDEWHPSSEARQGAPPTPTFPIPLPMGMRKKEPVGGIGNKQTADLRQFSSSTPDSAHTPGCALSAVYCGTEGG